MNQNPMPADLLKPSPLQPNEILTIAEAARILRCSKAHVCKAVNGKLKDLPPIPSIPLGRRKLIRRTALENWLASCERDGSPSFVACSWCRQTRIGE